MIDTACILFSALMCLFVAFRAIQLDRALAWFAGALPAIRAAGAAMLPSRGTATAPVATASVATASAGGWRDRARAPSRAPRPGGWRSRPAQARRGRDAS